MRYTYRQYMQVRHRACVVIIRRWRNILFLGIASSSLLSLVVACGELAPTQQSAPWVAPSGAYAPSWFDSARKQSFRSHGQYIAAAAISIASALYGNRTNEYDQGDPALVSVIAYWKRTCQNNNGSLCSDAASGNLQCVEFVSGLFAQIDDELPYGSDANQFWHLYQGKAEWQEIPASATLTNAPNLGDMMVWTGNSAGHLAIVVDLQAPTKSSDGYIVVAQANAAYAFERLAWHINGRIDSWASYQLQGFIRQQEIAPCLRRQASPLQQQWETLAIETAVHYGIPSKYFLRQLCQSGFRSGDQQENRVINGTGAIGIAQLTESISAHIPRCVINFVANAPDCDQMPGSLPAGRGIDPKDPAEAIPASAYEMSMLYSHYLDNKLVRVPQDDFKAYKMALASYKVGETAVDKSLSKCGKTRWLSCLDSQQKNRSTSKYIGIILAVSNE